MISKKIIIRASKTSYSEENGCYVTESALWRNTSGVGETPEEAFSTFITLLEMEYKDYLTGSHVKSRREGKYAKRKTHFDEEIEPEVKEALIAMAKDIGLSQGEVIEYLLKGPLNNVQDER